MKSLPALAGTGILSGASSSGVCWCAECRRDFIPEHGGVFDGPIPVKAAHLLGLCFSRINLKTGVIERERCCDVGE